MNNVSICSECYTTQIVHTDKGCLCMCCTKIVEEYTMDNKKLQHLFISRPTGYTKLSKIYTMEGEDFV